jgi:large subunit ribosomal protein L13Ae
MSFQKEVIVDASGNLLGRLSATIAKELLQGQKVTVVRCEQINVSGSLFRQRLKYMEFKRKTNNVNPKHGPFHYRAPSKILWRTIRGMLPHKTARGQAALDRLSTFEGMPHPYDLKKKVVIPQALKMLRLKPYRKYCVLGDLSQSVGWKCQDLLKKLEAKRVASSTKFFTKKKAVQGARKTATAAVLKTLSKEEQALAAKVSC